MKLEDIRFQTPCTVPWESMKGNDRVRFCRVCKLAVTNVSAMSREEAEKLLEQAVGPMCIQLWKRPDGTIVTSDCGRIDPGPMFRTGGTIPSPTPTPSPFGDA